MEDCPGPQYNFKFNCDDNLGDPDFKSYRYKTDWIIYDASWIKDLWVNKGQKLKHYNWETNEIEWWEATKDILDTKDYWIRYEERLEEYKERKQITAQANFKWLNQQ